MQIQELSLDKNTVDRLTDSQLVDAVLNYPLLGDIILFDSIDDAKTYFSKSSYLFQKLFQGHTYTKIILNEYDRLCLSSIEHKKKALSNDDELQKVFFQKLFIERFYKNEINLDYSRHSRESG
ncbi:MAG: hypothetical protein ACI4FY_12630 [Acetatifactor sp.]